MFAFFSFRQGVDKMVEVRSDVSQSVLGSHSFGNFRFALVAINVHLL
jgi:hypothetical protein